MDELELQTKIEEIIDNWDEPDQLDVWNEYCESNSYDDDRIYYMSDFWDIFAEGMSPEELIQLGRDGDFDPSDDYFKYTIYGPESFNTIWDNIETSDLADYIIRNDEDFGDDEIRELLDAYNEEDEDEDEDTEYWYAGEDKDTEPKEE